MLLQNLLLFSKQACKKELFTVSTLSTGALLNITFLVIVFAYLIIGITVDYFLMGARGIEVIPNLAFWKDFPFLVRVRICCNLSSSIVSCFLFYFFISIGWNQICAKWLQNSTERSIWESRHIHVDIRVSRDHI